MLMHLKKCGSPSSASLEDSDEKPSPGSSNLQLRTSGPGFGRGPGDDQRPSHSGIQPGSSHEPMTNTDEAQAYLSAMSLSTPTNPLMLHSSKHQLTMMASTADDSDDNTVYQQYLPGRTVESRSLRVAPSSVDDFLILRQSWNSPACWVQGTSAGQTGPVPLSAISPLGADVGHPTWSRSEIAGVRLVDSWWQGLPFCHSMVQGICFSGLEQMLARHLDLPRISSSEYEPGTTIASAKSPSSRWIRQVSHISSELDSPPCTYSRPYLLHPARKSYTVWKAGDRVPYFSNLENSFSDSEAWYSVAYPSD